MTGGGPSIPHGFISASWRTGFLVYMRSAIADKAADAPEPQVRTGGVPSVHALHTAVAAAADEARPRYRQLLNQLRDDASYQCDGQ
jgi:hypothetical protein